MGVSWLSLVGVKRGPLGDFSHFRLWTILVANTKFGNILRAIHSRSE